MEQGKENGTSTVLPEEKKEEELLQGEGVEPKVELPEKNEETTVVDPNAEYSEVVALRQIGSSGSEQREESEKMKENLKVDEEETGINGNVMDRTPASRCRKPRVASTDKPKVTVPRPFNFATDQMRTAREVRREADKLKPLILSKSITNTGVRPAKQERSSSVRAERSPELRVTGTKDSSINGRPGKKQESVHVAEELRRKETEVQISQGNTIKAGEESETAKKTPISKSSPSPSFRQERKTTPGPEIKKTPFLSHGRGESLSEAVNRGSDATSSVSPRSRSTKAETSPSVLSRNAARAPKLRNTPTEAKNPDQGKALLAD